MKWLLILLLVGTMWTSAQAWRWGYMNETPDEFKRRWCSRFRPAYRCQDQNYYLQNKCAYPVYFVVTSFESACHEIWDYVSDVANARGTVFEMYWVLQHGCILDNDQYVLSDDVAVAMLNSLYWQGRVDDYVYLSNSRGLMLNYIERDGCGQTVDVFRKEREDQSPVDAKTERYLIKKDDHKFCKNSCENDNHHSVVINYCKVCCSSRCKNLKHLYASCCNKAHKQTTCQCTENNLGSACGC